MAPILGYWQVRSLGEQIRLLMHYLGIEYEDKQYIHGQADGEWLKDKNSLGLDFPNLPYYIDGDYKITQSAAILEYIADRHDMVPLSKKHRAEHHMLNGEFMDFRQSFFAMVFNPEIEKMKVDFLKTLPDRLRRYENFLGDKQWMLGDKISYPEFNLCELFGQLERFAPGFMKGFPKLEAYLKRFENLPGVKEYMATPEFKKRWCYPAAAQWQGRP